MTLTSTTSRNDYIGAGTVGPFPYTFKIFAAADLVVTKYFVTEDVEQLLTLDVDYTVAGAGVGSGGSITLTAALAVGDRLIIRRVRPATQATSIRDQGAFLPEIHEDVFDHQAMVGQQHEEALSRTVQLPVSTEPSTDISPNLPTPQAGMTLGWDASGKKLTNIAQGGRGPAGVGGPVPIFNTPADRDAFYPVPAVDNAAIVKSVGYQMRYGAPATGANKWLANGLTRDGGMVITAQSQGLVADGVTDDAPFLAAADAAAVASGGRQEIDSLVLPGQTRVTINSNLTLSAPFHAWHGQKTGIYIAAGKTLTIAAPFMIGGVASLWRVFDPTSPGNIVFTGPQPEFNVHNFGITGLGLADDSQALTWMCNQLPNQARVRLPQGLVCRLDYTWLKTFRTGFTFIGGDGMPFDDYGAGFRPRFKWNGIAGGTALGFYSDGMTTFVGCVFDFQNASVGLDYDSLYIGITNGNTALTSNQNGGAGPVVGAGPAFFRSLPPNCDIAISGGAAGGGLFRTTISAVADDTHATLAAAPTGLTNAQASVSFGKGGVDSGQRICTRLRLIGCFFRSGALVDCLQVANSKTSQNNGEYPEITCCKFSGGGLQQPNIPQNGGVPHRGNFNFGNFDGVSWPAPGGQIVAGTNVLAGFTVDTFSASMDQMPIWVVGAGASFSGPNGDGTSAGAHGTLFGYVKWTGSARSIQITATPGGANLNATNTSAVGGAFSIGRSFGTGFYNGPSANAKRLQFFNNEWELLQYGIDCQGGSLTQIQSNYADLDINVRLGAAMSEGSSEYTTNTENSRQHLLYSGGQGYVIYPGRYAFVYARAGKGFFEFTGIAGAFKIEPCAFDNHLPTGAAVLDLHHVGGQGVELIGGRFPYIDGSVADKTGYLGVNNLPEGTYVHQVGCSAGLAFFAAEEVYNNLTNSGAGDGAPMRFFGGSTFLAGVNLEPADNNFKYVRLGVLWFKQVFGYRLLMKAKHEDGLTYMHELPRSSIPLILVDAANLTPESLQNRTFFLTATAGVGANRTINIPAHPADGELFTFKITNSTGGPIVTTWSGYNMPAWVDPANGKTKSVTFVYYQGTMNQVGAPSADY